MMRIGYLMNTYPVTSSTFIRREMQSLEKSGISVTRYAVRRWSDDLVDERDKAEQNLTTYLLSDQIPGLLLGFFSELLTNPTGFFRAIGAWTRLVRNANGGIVRHAAYLLEAIKLRKLVERDRIDHIHTHFSTNAAAVALLCKRLGGPGFSFTAHGPDEFVDWGQSSLAFKVAEAQFAVAISHYSRVQLARAAGMQFWDKLHIVKCGLDVDEFSESKSDFKTLAPFVCVGRLCPQKAQVLLVEAAAIVAKDRPELRVELIGDGESRANVEAAIERHGLHENVILLGWRNNTEVRDILGKSRALLLPSFAEGLPVVIMEALALGRPAISTFIAGIPELVDRGCGWIIPSGSVEDIAAAMTQAMDATPSELKDMGQEGRRRVLQAHDIHKNAAALAVHFQNAVDRDP